MSIVTRTRRLALGLCADCGRAPRLEPTQRCGPCAKLQLARVKRRQAEIKKEATR